MLNYMSSLLNKSLYKNRLKKFYCLGLNYNIYVIYTLFSMFHTSHTMHTSNRPRNKCTNIVLLRHGPGILQAALCYSVTLLLTLASLAANWNNTILCGQDKAGKQLPGAGLVSPLT